MAKGVYKMKSEVLVYPGMGGWRFLALPKKQAAEIKEKFGKQAKGWGSIRVSVTVGKTKWQTSIFPDKRSGTYLLPLKAEVRRAEGVGDKDHVQFEIKI